jgi:chromosome partitioning protein
MHEEPLENVVEPTDVKNLFVAPASLDLAGAEIELVPAFSREQRLKRAVESVLDDYDYVLIDCPPSLGLLTVNGLAAADEVLVPIQCEYYALEGLGQLLRNVSLVQQNVNPALRLTGIVMTMFDPRTKLAEQVVEDVRTHYGPLVYETIIPRSVRLSEAPGFGEPITVYDPRSRGAECYRALAREVMTRPIPGVVDAGLGAPRVGTVPRERPERAAEEFPGEDHGDLDPGMEVGVGGGEDAAAMQASGQTPVVGEAEGGVAKRWKLMRKGDQG